MEKTERDRLVELAVGSLMASSTIHADLERLRYEAWKKDKTKGKKRWEPKVDRASLCATFEDLFGQAYDVYKEHRGQCGE